MLAIAGIFLLTLSALRFWWTVRRGIYRRYPVDQFALVGGSAILGLLSVIRSPSAVEVGLFVVELAALVAVVRFFGFGVRYPRERTRVEVGQRFPEFAVLDSDGRPFDSRSVLGVSSALFIFFRGHF